jgi:hypothetical protein
MEKMYKTLKDILLSLPQITKEPGEKEFYCILSSKPAELTRHQRRLSPEDDKE